jgi:tetratricopeptide (TPR) repeat protein
LWGAQYDRKLADIFSLQEQIATEISSKLRLRLTGEEQKRLRKRYTESKEAYQLYLKGHYYWVRGGTDNVARALQAYRSAADIDPSYTVAYTGQAECHFQNVWSGDESAREGLSAAKQVAHKALMLDDALAEAHVQAGMARAFYDWDWTGAEMEFRSALDLYAGNPAWLHDWCGFFFPYIGRFDDSISQFQQALELDPLSAGIHGDFGGSLARWGVVGLVG